MTASAKAVGLNSELKRVNSNTQRIQEMHPYMRPKIRAVLTDMEAHGYKPLIDRDVWRSPSQQLIKVLQGYSQVKSSFHTTTTCDGVPRPCTPKADSLAADIVDASIFWSVGKPFWLNLASTAESHDLTTGIFWGLSVADRKRIHNAIDLKHWASDIPLGWDTAHVEPVGITLTQASHGYRLIMKNGNRHLVKR